MISSKEDFWMIAKTPSRKKKIGPGSSSLYTQLADPSGYLKCNWNISQKKVPTFDGNVSQQNCGKGLQQTLGIIFLLKTIQSNVQ